MGDLALAVVISIGDLAAYVLGRLLGRKLELSEEKALRAGQIVLASALIGTLAVITIVY